MSGWIKYFENGGKSMSFIIEDDSVYLKYNDTWNKIKELLGVLNFIVNQFMMAAISKLK